MGREYYRRLHYLMGDYSPHVLELARENVNEHARARQLPRPGRHCARPTTLGFLRYKAFLIYISNVYDNLPTDEIVRIGGQLTWSRCAPTSPPRRERIAAAFGVGPRRSAGPDRTGCCGWGPSFWPTPCRDRFPDAVSDAVDFWRRVWDALRLEERYVPLEGLDIYMIAPGVSGELLRPILEPIGDVRMHVSNGAAASFMDTLPLLHPFGGCYATTSS